VVEAGFRKCTSGVTSGFIRHEIVAFILEICYDLFPIDLIVKANAKIIHFFIKPTSQKVE